MSRAVLLSGALKMTALRDGKGRMTVSCLASDWRLKTKEEKEWVSSSVKFSAVDTPAIATDWG